MPSHAQSRRNHLPLIGCVTVLAFLVAALAWALSGLYGDAQSAAQPEVAAQVTPRTLRPSDSCRDDVVAALTRYGLARQSGDGNAVLNDEQQRLDQAEFNAFSAVFNDFASALVDPARRDEGLVNTITALTPAITKACSAADLRTTPLP